MLIKTTHRGYEISYSEVDDLWRCQSLWPEDASLSKLKEKINRIDVEVRRIDAVPAYLINYDNTEEVKVTSLTDERTHAWIVQDSRRSKAPLAKLVPITDETRKQAAEVKRLINEARLLREKSVEIVSELPRMTPEMLMKKS